MESFCWLIVKIVLTVIILGVIALCFFHILLRKELESLTTKEDIDTLYDNIQVGDVLTLRLSSIAGRIIMSPIASFFHYVIVVKLPNDDNKYILHTRNKGIRPLIFPDLKTNVLTLGKKSNYQLVHLKEYLSYIKNKQEFIVHLKTHNDFDYTLNMKMVDKLPEWKSYTRQHCGYLVMTLMYREGWTSQKMYSSYNKTYYSPDAIHDRLIEYDNYTYEGIIQPV